jgi:hypothetical protein
MDLSSWSQRRFAFGINNAIYDLTSTFAIMLPWLWQKPRLRAIRAIGFRSSGELMVVFNSGWCHCRFVRHWLRTLSSGINLYRLFNCENVDGCYELDYAVYGSSERRTTGMA